MKEAAFKGLVRPVSEYGSSVWDPHTHSLQKGLEKFQNRAARFVTVNYVFETGSMTSTSSSTSILHLVTVHLKLTISLCRGSLN